MLQVSHRHVFTINAMISFVLQVSNRHDFTINKRISFVLTGQ